MANTDYPVENLWKTCGKIRRISGKLFLKISQFFHKNFQQFFQHYFQHVFNNFFNSEKSILSRETEVFHKKSRSIIYIKKIPL
jgi:hypothetical protein